ncbi:MAG: CotH kinase family protein [Pseudomonadota bacterium]|nr:CotH kinase family protein [Pseudomonadota bacterium]
MTDIDGLAPDREPSQNPPPITFHSDWDARVQEEDISDAFLYREGVVHDLFLTVEEDALDALADSPDEDVAAALNVDRDPEAYAVGLRLKGTSSFRTLKSKPAFKIDFHQWDPEARFHGLKRMTLNNMVQDPTMMHEHVYYWFCARLGIPAPRHGYAHVWLNGEDFGLYGIVETMDEQFINRVWPEDDDGPLYEAMGSDFTTARSEFEVEEEGTGLLIGDVITTVESTPRDEYLAMLETHFDLDALLGYWALDIVTSNPDGYTLNHNNFYVYGAPLAARWTLVPSGVDRSFVATPRDLAGALALGCRADDACEARLEERIEAVIEAWDTLDLLAVVTEMESVVGPLCQADPRRDRECRSEEILSFIEERREQLR